MREYSRYAYGFVCVGLLAILSGCPDPDVEFASFQERCDASDNPNTGCKKSETGSGGGMTCTAPMPGEMDGEWIFALTPAQSPTKPAPLKTTLTTMDAGGTLQFTMEHQPLDANDRMTEVGTPFTVGPFDVAADGTFSADWGTITIPGETNPLTESVLTADVVIDGALCPGDFVCGIANGQITSPVMLNIDGSNWTMTKLDAYTEPPALDCAGKLAAPL